MPQKFVNDIFLSYAREDQAFAKKLAQALEAQGWSVWWDATTPTGTFFDDVIQEAISAVRCVVVLWSSTSVTSRWVKSEAQEGADRNILAPVLVEADVPIPLGFRLIQAADLSDWNGDQNHPSFKKLAADIGMMLDRSPSHDEEQRIPRAGGEHKPKMTEEPQVEEKLPRSAIASVPAKAVHGRIGKTWLVLGTIAIVTVSVFFFISIQDHRYESTLSNLGTVVVTSTPSGADVFLKGAWQNKTPTRSLITPGRMPLRVELKGYKTIEDTIEVVKGGTEVRNYVLVPVRAALSESQRGYAFPVIRSMKDLNGAIDWARGLRKTIPEYPVEVYLAENDYYAVTLGGYLSREEAENRVKLARDRKISPDAYVWQSRNWGHSLLKE
jgi:hypothetical protein